MHHDKRRGISRAGLDASFTAEEMQKSSLLLQAKWAREQGFDGEAARLFAEAAALEESLADASAARGLKERSQMHYFSAASCWAQAGDFHHAITLCERLLAADNLTDRLRARVADYASILRERRARWYSEVVANIPA